MKRKIIIREKNLWNYNNGKTREVIKYINSLQYDKDFTNEQKVKFDRIKDEALSKFTTDDMLKRIGYNINKPPTIYDEVYY